MSRALKTSDINTIDLDRNNGIFYVSFKPEEDPGIFSFLGFNREPSSDSIDLNKSAEFRVEIKEKNKKTYVRVFSKNDKIEEAENLLSKINESLS